MESPNEQPVITKYYNVSDVDALARPAVEALELHLGMSSSSSLHDNRNDIEHHVPVATIKIKREEMQSRPIHSQ